MPALTWNEIRARYPDEFLALADIGWADPGGPDIVTARVVCHARGFLEIMAVPSELIVFPLTGRGGPRRPRVILDGELR